MREAIITIVVPDTTDEPAHTEVWRVEFEGDHGITGEVDNTDTFELKNVVNIERLAASDLPQHQYNRG